MYGPKILGFRNSTPTSINFWPVVYPATRRNGCFTANSQPQMMRNTISIFPSYNTRTDTVVRCTYIFLLPGTDITKQVSPIMEKELWLSPVGAFHCNNIISTAAFWILGRERTYNALVCTPAAINFVMNYNWVTGRK